jgi:multimeric flavodoxin WrbA
MNILIIVAGTNDPSNSHMLAESFEEGISSYSSEIEIEMIRLKDLSIDHFNLTHYKEEVKEEEDFIRIKKHMIESSGIVLASPIWNFGVPAHLKNLMDRIGSFALDKTRSQGTLNGKPFYLIVTGGAPIPAWKGLIRKTSSYVSESIKYFGGTIFSTHFEPKCTAGKGGFKLVVDKRENSLDKLKEEGARFAEMTDKYAKNGKLPVKQKCVKKMYSIGQRISKKVT